MNAPLLVGSKAPALAPPTAQEQEAIEKFASSKKQLDALRRLVAHAMAETVNDPHTAGAKVQMIFSATDTALEKAVSKRIEDFEPWSYGSAQPSLLTRAVNVPSLTQFLKAGFGVPDVIIGDEGSDGFTGRERSFVEFFFRAFLEEVKLSRKCGLPASVDEAVQIIWRGKARQTGKERTLEKWVEKKLKGRWPTHTVAWREEDKYDEDDYEWFQYLIHAPEPGQITGIQGEMLSWEFESDDHDEIIFRFPLERFLKIRREINATRYYDILNSFPPRWDRERFFSKLNLESAFYSSSDELADLFLDAIIRGALPTDDAVEEGRDDPENAPERVPPQARSLDERMAELDAFAHDNPGKPVSPIARELFPELELISNEKLSLPAEAPAKWPVDRVAVHGVLETPPDFLRRNYAPWLGSGLNRADIRKLDPSLSTALDNWLRRHAMPTDLDLPTIEEQNSTWLDRINRGETVRVGSSFLDAEGYRAALRLQAAEQRRKRGSPPERQ